MIRCVADLVAGQARFATYVKAPLVPKLIGARLPQVSR
jgi:hypothetical protein